MKHVRHISLTVLLAIFSVLVIDGCGGAAELSGYDAARKAALDTIKAGRFDGGRMWTFEYPPLEYFQETYGFRPDQQWLDDVRMAALRFGGGCSASFVSADGLVMTNHHCARGGIVQVQKPGEKLMETGFYANTLQEERQIPNLSVEQLVEIRDVTREVQSAVDAVADDQAKVEARAKSISDIQKTAEAQSKLRAQVVPLYNGGKFALYLYKRYSDVRLVAAPELHNAHFGGEFDNFTYPRYALDFSFVRVYDEEGKPLKTDHYFKWSTAGAKENELVFVVGNPGRTSRLNTAAQLEYNRDVAYPFTSRILDDRVDVLARYAETHPDKKEAMLTQILGIANSQKAYAGRLSGLRDERLMQRRYDFDRQFRQKVEASPALMEKYGHLWDAIASGRQRMRSIAPEMQGLRMNGLGVSGYFSKAYALVRFAAELAKPEQARDKDFQGDGLEKAKTSLARFTQLDPDMEQLTLVKQFRLMKEQLGADDAFLRFLLQGQDDEQAARRLIAASQLNDSVRYGSYVGDPAAIDASMDPFILAARMALPRLDRVNATVREINAQDQVNNSLLGRALFDIYGTSIPPDATFTLRLADGIVKGFEYNGTKAPPITTFYGLFDRNASFPDEESWQLSERWKNLPKDFDLSTPLNFSSTNDIIGGNSGSPMINKHKEVVGLIFDGNIESLPGDFIFAEDAGNRTVSVHAAGIFAALKHVIKADRLVSELQYGKMAAE